MLADPFVGRHVELEALRRAVDAAARGRGSIALLAGEPGIGKSRLATVMAEHALERGFVVRRAACWEEPGAPFWPWTQLLRGEVGPAVPEGVRMLAGDPIVGGGRFLDGDAEPVRIALFDSVSRYLVAQASREPILLILDDLQWADVGSLRLLAYVARVLADASVVVIGTFRDVEVDRDSDVGRALESVSSAADVMKLDGLRTGEVAQLLAESSGALAPTGFARDVHERTGGNPLFVRELARLLSAPGRTSADIATLPVPEGVHGVIRRRLARMSQPTQELLSAAAVLGPEFRADVVAHTANIGRDLALDLLDAAVQARLVAVIDGAPGRYGFTHALVRDVLYGSIPPSRRAALHRRAAEAIEGSGPVDEHLAELAFHHLHGSLGGDTRRAVDFAERAGRHALEQLAYEDAAAHFERALEALRGAPDDDRRTSLMLDLGDARLRAGDMPGARDVFDAAADVARRRERPEDLARAALGFGAGLAGFEVQLYDQRQIALLEDALSALPDADSPLRAWILARLTVALSMQESVERRAAVADEAVAMARRVGDDRALAYALAAHCDTIAGPADSERRLDESDEIIAIARQIADRALELLGRRHRIEALLEMGDVDAVSIEVERYAGVADLMRQPLYTWYVSLWRGMFALLRGDFEGGALHTAEAEAIGARAHSVNAQMLVVVQRWISLTHQGRDTESVGTMEMLTQLMSGYGDPYFALGHAWLYGQAGELELARASLRRMPDPSGAWIPFDSEWIPSMCQLAFALDALDEADTAAAVYERLVPYRARFGVEGIGAAMHGSLERPLGLLARTAGRLDDAVEHFEAALVANARIGARCIEAWTTSDLATTLERRCAQGDAARAADVRSRAVALFRELGLDEVAARVHRTDAAPAPAATPASNVFRAEGDVWTLVFDGELVRVKDVKGLHDIARLLARPGAEVPALDLVMVSAGAKRHPREEASDLRPVGHAGQLLDEEARARYKARLDELDDDIASAEELGDAVRAERAKEERDALVRELSSAYGLGGRPRRAGDPSERARTTVTRRIREAITRISDVHPALGRHLQNSIRTGTYCAYVPEQSLDWAL